MHEEYIFVTVKYIKCCCDNKTEDKGFLFAYKIHLGIWCSLTLSTDNYTVLGLLHDVDM